MVIFARPDFNANRGSFALTALEIRAVGVGELLARLDRLRRQLGSEGLFSPDRKRALPFLPHVIGLICGRDSAAERDVLRNAARRWPAVRFRVEQTAVQGAFAAEEVTDALQRLDADAEVDVIVIARGGGSLEDLLPFSDETLIRAVAACRTPVVSAIGHEQDTPLLDYVADVRASTPTDAAKRVVPDVSEQLALIARCGTGPGGRCAAGWTGRRPGCRGSGPGRCWPTRSGKWNARPNGSRRCGSGPGCRCRPAWPAAATTWPTPGPGWSPCHPRPPCAGAMRSCSTPTTAWSGRPRTSGRASG